MRKVNEYIRGRFLYLLIETVERFVREFSAVTICVNWGIISNTYSDAALLQETANGGGLILRYVEYSFN
jgi:hypothetical protein